MADRALDKDRLRQVTPEILNEHLWQSGWSLVDTTGEMFRWSRCASDFDDLLIPQTKPGAGYEYIISYALGLMSEIEGRPEADILCDLLAGKEQPQPIEVKPWRVVIPMDEVNDGEGKRHFVLPDTYISFCGKGTEPMQYMCRTDFSLTSLDHTVWPAYHCRACRERLREIGRDMMRRLGYTLVDYY